MPELPEVETVRRQLHERIAGKTIREVVMYKTGKETPAGTKFVQALVGRQLSGVERRAKLLIFRFTDSDAMLGHLKMTGKFSFLPAGQQPTPAKHDRILFVFDATTQLVWSDVRMFGYLKLVTAEEAKLALAHYGPEPLEASAVELAEHLNIRSTRTIKAALLDQTIIAGIGNIYADEALFRARIQPTHRLDCLAADERIRLAKAIKKVLAEALVQKGTSAVDFLDTRGEKGSFQKFLRVYGRAGQPCVVCEQPIIRSVVAQRGTHTCNYCQK